MDEKSTPPPTPPPPPPLPPTKSSHKISKHVLKVRRAPPGWAFQSLVNEPFRNTLISPTGTYFFYGTLADPGMLNEILNLSSKPSMRPAYVLGYEKKLWGQYPALVDGKAGAIVEETAFDVPDDASAAKLQEYETKNYHPAPCNIRFNDGGEPNLIEGFTFLFCGNTEELTDGDFDLSVWLQRIGRKPKS